MDEKRKSARGSAAGWHLAGAAALLLGCQTVTVDLGSNERDAGSGGGGSSAPLPVSGLVPVTTSDCPSVTEAEVAQIYGYPCVTTCAAALGTPRAVASSTTLEALVSGQWRTCAGATPWAADVVGIEFQAGCTIFLLHDAPDAGRRGRRRGPSIPATRAPTT